MAKRLEVRVIFRVWKDTGSVIAFFPDLTEGRGLVQSYEHVGQHGVAAYPNNTRPATKAEYASLKRELEGPPFRYRLRVIKRNVAPRY